MKLLLVDSNSILNRAFYGIKLLTTKNGMYTNAIYGFLNILNKLLGETGADAVAFAFDLKAPTFRHKMFDEYKAGRKGMPDELRAQMPIIRELLPAMGYKVVEIEGYEADDVLGTLSAAGCAAGIECIIATGDRDSLQLVNDCVSVSLASAKMGKPETIVYTPAAIEEKYGVTPLQLIEVKALMGDSSDNIPGVPGIGEKTALDLISRFDSVKNIYANLEILEMKDGVRKKLQAGRESAFMSRELAEICLSVPVCTDFDEYVKTAGNPALAAQIFRELELFSLAEKFGVDTNTAPAAKSESGEPPAVIAPTDVLPLAALEPDFLGEENIFALFDISDDIPRKLAVNRAGTVYIGGSDAPNFDSVVRGILENSDRLVTTDSKDIYRFAFKNGIDIPRVKFDLGLAAYLQNPNAANYDLARLTDAYAPGGILPTEYDSDVLARSAAALPQIFCKLEAEIKLHEQDKLLENIEMPLAKVLAAMEIEGFALDTDGLSEFGRVTGERLAELEKTIYLHAGKNFNINSPKQLGEILFGELMLPTRRKTKSGYSTDAEVLESLVGKHPIIEDILEYRTLMKLKSTYVDGLMKVVGDDGRVHTSFKQTETRTGRISSAEPNMQNIPVRTELGSNLRKFFHAKPGCTLLDADYSQIELRVLAHISDDPKMIDAFENDADIHTKTAAEVFKMPEDFVTPLMRSRAKAVNFGIVYGIGAFSLAKDIGVSNAEASEYIKGYLDTYQGVRQYMESIKQFGTENGYVSTLFGRRRPLPELASSNKITKAFGERVAMNTPIQGTAADIIKIAMIKVYERLKSENLRAKLVLQVHDELIVECPADEVNRAKEILKTAMESAADLKVHLDADVGVGTTWLEAK